MSDVVFSTPDVGRVFLVCHTCHRVKPHWDISPSDADGEDGDGRCRHCGDNTVIPFRIPEWHAAWWVLVKGWLWRKTIRRKERWDPRLPWRQPT
jgi:hypothetical protein